jgi:hypothetical protein
MIDEDDFWSNWWNENWQGKPLFNLNKIFWQQHDSNTNKCCNIELK